MTHSPGSNGINLKDRVGLLDARRYAVGRPFGPVPYRERVGGVVPLSPGALTASGAPGPWRWR